MGNNGEKYILTNDNKIGYWKLTIKTKPIIAF